MSSSAYPVIWALKHAPVADALERLILVALADAADADGCNSYRSQRAHLEILVDVSKSTFTRRLRDMEQRGLIRADTTPPPARYLKIPRYLRPTRWEVCIPYSWWSDAQREQIQREREDRGLPRITPESRPDLDPAPARRTRADKGKPNPKRGRPKKQQPSADPDPAKGPGVLKTPGPEDSTPCLEDTPPGVLKTPPPCLEDTQPSWVNPPQEPSSSSYSSVTDVAPSAGAEAGQEEEEESPRIQELNGVVVPKGQQALDKAEKVLDAAVDQWQGHRAPTRTERRKLALRVAEALAEGALPFSVMHVLTRDLELAQTRNAVAVVMHRTAQPEWWSEVRVPVQPTTAPKPPWCGVCSETTRLTENAEGKVIRCKACHPFPHARDEDEQDDAVVVDAHQGDEVLKSAGHCEQHGPYSADECPRCLFQRSHQRMHAKVGQ